MEENYNCPYCDTDLRETGLGGTFKADQVMTEYGWDDLEVGDFIEYFCPTCGKILSGELGTALELYFQENAEED